MSDEKGPDEKVICVPLNDPTWGRLTDIHDIPPVLRDEIEHFFQVYKDLDHKGSVVTNGFGNRSEAEQVINEARAAAACAGRLNQNFALVATFAVGGALAGVQQSA